MKFNSDVERVAYHEDLETWAAQDKATLLQSVKEFGDYVRAKWLINPPKKALIPEPPSVPNQYGTSRGRPPGPEKPVDVEARRLYHRLWYHAHKPNRTEADRRRVRKNNREYRARKKLKQAIDLLDTSG